MSKLLALVLSMSLGFAQTPAIPVTTLTGRNTVMLTLQMTGASMDAVMAALVAKRAFAPDSEPIYLVIYSGGGEYGATKALIRFLPHIKNLHVICGFCASAAGLAFASFKGERLVLEHGTVLMHEMYLSHVTAAMAMNPMLMLSLIEASNEFNQILANTIGMSIEAYEKKILDTEWTVTGKKVVKLHLADKVTKIHCDEYIQEALPEVCY